jgi:hypothetical protein
MLGLGSAGSPCAGSGNEKEARSQTLTRLNFFVRAKTSLSGSALPSLRLRNALEVEVVLQTQPSLARARILMQIHLLVPDAAPQALNKDVVMCP